MYFFLCCAMYCLCVIVYCHRVTTQLQLINIIIIIILKNVQLIWCHSRKQHVFGSYCTEHRTAFYGRSVNRNNYVYDQIMVEL
jgi:hypothetical protein